MNDTYMKLYRSLIGHPKHKDPEFMWVWVILLLKARWTPTEEDFAGEFIITQPGQLITGRKSLAQISGVNEHKVDRILKRLENEQRIEQRITPFNRLITIVNWGRYQNSEQPVEQRLSNLCATIEQRSSTIKEGKKENKEKKKEPKRVEDIYNDELDVFGYKDSAVKLAEQFITAVKAVYPKAKLDVTEQAGYFYRLLKQEYTYKLLSFMVDYYDWSNTDGKNMSNTFNWYKAVRSAAKLLDSKEGITYCDRIIQAAREEWRRANDGEEFNDAY